MSQRTRILAQIREFQGGWKVAEVYGGMFTEKPSAIAVAPTLAPGPLH